MKKVLGIGLVILGFLGIITGVILGQSGISIEFNILGVFSPATAICFYGGAVVLFCGFALFMVKPAHAAV